MMEYEVFKKVIVERLMCSLPPLYADYEPHIRIVRKVNAEKEALTLHPPSADIPVAVPTIYLDDMYEIFSKNEDLDEIIKFIIDIIIRYTGFTSPELEDFNFGDKLDRLVINLVNTETNAELLNTVPHKNILDLSVIYRFIMCEEGDGFGTVVLTNELMEDIDMTIDELHETACRNTLRIFPLNISELFQGFYLMTNKHVIGGAATMVCRECTDQLAEKIGCDFFIIPSSIHEIYAVPAENHTVRNLIYLLEEGNRKYVDSSEMLSKSIYFYDFESREISIAGSYVTV